MRWNGSEKVRRRSPKLLLTVGLILWALVTAAICWAATVISGGPVTAIMLALPPVALLIMVAARGIDRLVWPLWPLGVASALALNSGLHVTGNGTQPWAGPPSAVPSAIGDPTKPTWPLDGNGEPQEDATARSGEHYEQGEKLLEQVLAVVPGGWTTPTGTIDGEISLRYHQAEANGEKPGSTWAYSAHAAVRKDDRTGRLMADVHTPGNGLPSEACALARKFWVTGGTCTVVTVGKRKVGVVTLPAGTDRADQWAAYRHPDGTVVFLSQSRDAANTSTSLKPLKNLPLSKQQLATLAVDDRFRLS